jgi:ATP-binding cassette, subfamily F, member 3
LLGKNGSGKTTILELATGALKSQQGRILFGKNITLGYFKQTRTEFSEFDTPIDVIRRVMPQYTEGKVRDFLAGFLFAGEDVFRRMSTFSGGQRSRLSLALLMAAKPNLLVLDEPTNHLDIPSLEALENAIEEFNGTLLIVSHDRYFLDSVVDRILVLDDCEIETILGNYSYYEAKKREIVDEIEQPKTKIEKVSPRAKSKRINPLIVQKIEDDIAALESQLRQIETDLEDSQYASDWQRLNDLQAKRTEIEEQVLHLYEKLDGLNGQQE